MSSSCPAIAVPERASRQADAAAPAISPRPRPRLSLCLGPAIPSEEATQPSKDLRHLPLNVYLVGYFPPALPVASPTSRSLSRALGLTLVAVVLAALGVVIAHSIFGFGSSHSYFIEEWVYDFVTMSAALATLWRAAVRREERLAWTLLGFGLFGWAVGDL